LEAVKQDGYALRFSSDELQLEIAKYWVKGMEEK